MAIDPDILARQRIGPARAEPRDVKCDRCGRRTRDKTGTCSDCRGRIPDLRNFSSERLTGLVEACRAELKRRRDALNAALGEP